MASAIDRLKSRWRAGGLPNLPGVSPETLDAFEAKYRVKLSPDLREYFTEVGGSDDWDADLYSFWSWPRFVPLEDLFGIMRSEARWVGRWFIFADWAAESHYLAIQLSSDPDEEGPVVVVHGNGPVFIWVSPNFASFLELYLSEERHVFECGQEIEG